MRSAIPKFLVSGRFLVSILVLLSCALPVRAQTPNPEIEAAFEEQIAYVSALPPEAFPQGLRQGLLSKLQIARIRYLDGKPCTSANILTAFMHRARALSRRPEYLEIGMDLYYRGLLLRNDLLLSLPEDQTCPKKPVDAGCFEEAPWPELVAAELHSQPELPGDSTPTVIELMVVNRGGVGATNVPVTFVEEDQSFAESVVDVPACGVTELSVVWPGGNEGLHLIEARIDTNETLVEGLRSNNTAWLEIGVVFEAVRPWEAPDLILEGLTATPVRPSTGDVVVLEATIWHAGVEPLVEVAVRFSVDGVEIEEVLFDELEGGVETPVSGSWLATEPGRHYLTAEVELLSGDAERELDNNLEGMALNVGGGDPPLADLLVGEIDLDPATPSIGDPVTLTAEITNIGWATAMDFDVVFLAEEVPTELAPVASDVLPPSPGPVVLAVVNVALLEPGQTVEVQAAIEALDRPEMTVWVHVDPQEAVVKEEAPSVIGKRLAAVDPAALCKTDQSLWFSVGPIWLSNGWVGRIDSIAIDPDNPSTMFAAAPGGGVWRSLRGGAWTPLTDRMPSLATNEMIMDPTNSNILYAGTHAGLIKTIDGGNTWKVFADTKIGWYFDSLLLHYSGGSSFAFYAATNSGLWKYEGTDKYLLQSQFGDWKKIKTGSITGLAQYPDDPDRFLVGTMHPKTRHSQVWRSKSGAAPTSDASWENLSDGTHNLPTDSDGGMRVAIAPSNSNIMYAGLLTPKKPGIDTIPRMWRLYRSATGGESWQLMRSQISEQKYQHPRRSTRFRLSSRQSGDHLPRGRRWHLQVHRSRRLLHVTQ